METDMDISTKEDCIAWLSSIGCSINGTKEELEQRIARFRRFPGLVKKLKSRAEKAYSFPTSLDPKAIPQSTAHWKTEEGTFPKVDERIFTNYASQKREGSIGQQQKATQMLSSRKIVSVKTFHDPEGSDVFVRAMIKKSYGEVKRPAVVLFQHGLPRKGHCLYPVGLSGVCCHVLAILAFLKHYSESGEKILALTCTEQLQKWHRRSRKESIPMVPLRQIKLTSARISKKAKKKDLVAADSDNSRFKRDVETTLKEVKADIEKMKRPFSEHVYNVLQNSNIGRQSSLFGHLHYHFALKASRALVDHNYCNPAPFDEEAIAVDSDKNAAVEASISRALLSKSDSNEKESRDLQNNSQCGGSSPSNDQTTVYSAAGVTDKTQQVHESIETQLQAKSPVITIDLKGMAGPSPCGASYVDVPQNSDAWMELRKHKVTGSRLPALIGLYGKDKFDKYWRIVKEGLQESDLINTNLANFRRGHEYEQEAIDLFSTQSQSSVERCGFFEDPSDSRFGASPDGLAAASIVLEVKTRSKGASGPLESLDRLGHYVVQQQLEMLCTGALYCILGSYHPESKSATFFLVKKDMQLLSILKDVIDCILNEQPLISWEHHENKQLENLGKSIIGNIPNFALLKPLRVYINRLAKSVVKGSFS